MMNAIYSKGVHGALTDVWFPTFGDQIVSSFDIAIVGTEISESHGRAYR